MPRLLYVKTPAPNREPGLTAMIDEFKSEGINSYRTFSSLRELARFVRDDLALLLSERFAGRTSRADSSASTLPRRPRSLPVTTTSLIGRAQDVAAVLKLLEKPEVRLVTLSGPGGIGKTRLAIAVAEELVDRYPQGVVFIALESIAQPELVLPRIAAAMGAAIEGTRSPS
jgi:Cdc6-like AAA superfamily ATPase